MTTIKRPLPYSDGGDTFKAASAVEPGMLVTLGSSGVAAGGAVDDEQIGIVLYDHAVIANSGTTVYATGSMVPVKFRNEVIKVLGANPIAVGNFVKMAAAGRVGVEATAGTKTLNSIGIALTAGGTGEEINVVRL